MDLSADTDIESPHVKTDDKTLFNVIESAGDDEALKLLNSGQTFSQAELDAALISACRCGYKFLVHELVHMGADVQTKDRNGNTPLLICAEKCLTTIARFFIRRKVNINTANYFGDTALILAIRLAGSVEMVKLLLAQTEINVNHQNKEGYTALMKAIEAMDIDVIKLLLDSQENAVEVLSGIKNCTHETAQQIADKLGIGKVVNLLSKYNTKMNSPFLAAVQACDVDSFNILMDCQLYESESLNKKYIIQDAFKAVFTTHEKSGKTFNESEEKLIQRLLECGANLNECPYNSNPVLVATKVGSYNVLQMLLKFDLHTFSSWKQKDLLTIAAEHGHTHIVGLLIEHNPKLAAPNLATPTVNSAPKNGHVNCKQLPTKHGSSLDVKSAFKSAINSNNFVQLRRLVENSRAEKKRIVSAQEMNNLLVSAARRGYVETIGVLLDAGADVNCVNSGRKTPLMESKNAEVVNFLVQRGAVVNKHRRENSETYSPLTYVLSHFYYQFNSAEKEKIVEALLKHRASVNGKSCGGRTPLMVAVSNKANRNIVQMLLDHGADVTMKDDKGCTVLMVAADKKSTENIECLLQQIKVRNMINAQNKEGLTALMISTSKYNHTAVKVLIEHGADVNVKDVGGNTALLLAVSRHIEKAEILTTLIRAGSDINWQNKAGCSPLMLAAKAPKKNILTLLVNAGANVNAVSETAHNETALTLMFKNGFDFNANCVKYLLDHGARASYLKPDVLFRLIQQKQMQFIPKLIQCGLGPADIATSQIPLFNIADPVIRTVSPLCMALMIGNVMLACYFVGNLFVTKSDMSTLVHSQDVRRHLERNKHLDCLGFLNKLSAQPISLFSMAFIAVQSAVGASPGREERINTLAVPQVFKDRLLFKVENMPLDITDNDPPASAEGVSAVDHLIVALETFGSIGSLRYDYGDDYDHGLASSDDDYYEDYVDF